MSVFQIKQTLTSLKNPLIKQVSQLKVGKGRRKAGLFAIEGAREISRAILAGVQVEYILSCEEMLTEKTLDEMKSAGDKVSSVVAYGISQEIFEKLAMRDSHDGLIAVAKTFHREIETFSFPSNVLILVAEGVEKPGNLGAILRTADGAGVDAVLLADSPIDLFSAQTIRASLGAVFTIPIFHLGSEACLDLLRKHKVTSLAALPEAVDCYHEKDMTRSTAIILGSEAHGLSAVWRRGVEATSIPMAGLCDSLNVSVSAAILLYEAVRQRSQKPLQ